MPDAGVLATILLILGLFLLALELMIPSFGTIGILSAICLIISAWSAWQAWWGTHPGFFWTYFGFWLLGIPSVVGGTLFLLQHTSLGDFIILRGQENMAAAMSTEEQEQMESLVGQLAEAVSALVPGGMILVAGQRRHAVSQGMMIEAGQQVEVVGNQGPRLVVRPFTESSNSQQMPQEERANTFAQMADSTPEEASTSVNRHLAETEVPDEFSNDSGSSLDFQIPEG